MDRLAPLYSMLPPLPSGRRGRASALFRTSTAGRPTSPRLRAFAFSRESPRWLRSAVRPFPKCAASATLDRATEAVGQSVPRCPASLGQPKSWRHNVFTRFVPLSRGCGRGTLGQGDDRAPLRSGSTRPFCENEPNGWDTWDSVSHAAGTAIVLLAQRLYPGVPLSRGGGRDRPRAP